MRFVTFWFQALSSRRFQRGFDRVNLQHLTELLQHKAYLPLLLGPATCRDCTSQGALQLCQYTRVHHALHDVAGNVWRAE
jgi:hypothetical protein